MLFHILGRYHEHERPDRDRYIDFIEENIIQGIFKYNYCRKCYLSCSMYANYNYIQNQFSNEILNINKNSKRLKFQ